MSFEIIAYKHLFPGGSVEYTACACRVISRNSEGVPVLTDRKLLESCYWDTKQDAVNELKEIINELPDALNSPEHTFDIVHEEVTSKIAVKLVHHSDPVLDSHYFFITDMESGCSFYTAHYGQMRGYLSRVMNLKDGSLAKSHSKMACEYAMYLVKKSALPDFIAGKAEDGDYLPYPAYEEEKKLLNLHRKLKKNREQTCKKNAKTAFDLFHRELKALHAGSMFEKLYPERQAKFNERLLHLLSSTDSHTFSYDLLKDHVLFNMESHISEMPIMLSRWIKDLIPLACKEVSTLNKEIKRKGFVEL